MIALPNGCSRSEILAYPKNWKSNRASIKKDWLFQYRFYDPSFEGTKNWGKDIPIKGMNKYKDLKQRQEITYNRLKYELERLEEGYNPILKEYVFPQTSPLVQDIDPATPFTEALKLAEPRVDVVKAVHDDMLSIINAVEVATGLLFDHTLRRKYKSIPIEKVTSKHLIFTLEQCRKDNPELSDKRYNRYLAYLSMIFNKLKELQAVPANPLDNIDRKKTVTKKRAILTDKEAAVVDQHLFTKDYYLWRYMHIFFHSGARGTEMSEVKKGRNVDLHRQEFIVLVKKGNQYEEQTRVISNSVLHLWQEVWNDAKDGEYLFGSMLQPGPKKQGERYVSQRWQKYVKIELGIDKDWYSLKHKRSDLVAKKLSLKHSQEAAGHTSERTARIYAVGEDERRRDEVKGLDISLTG